MWRLYQGPSQVSTWQREGEGQQRWQSQDLLASCGAGPVGQVQIKVDPSLQSSEYASLTVY